MLSFQHIYHAGNFADVQKHAILVKLLQVLALKPQKFAFLDTDLKYDLPQSVVDIDRDKTARYGINTGDVDSVIQAALGGAVASLAPVLDRAGILPSS